MRFKEDHDFGENAELRAKCARRAWEEDGNERVAPRDLRVVDVIGPEGLYRVKPDREGMKQVESGQNGVKEL